MTPPLTRRSFVGAVAAAGAAPRVLGMLQDSSMSDTTRIRKAVKFGMVKIDGSLREKFELVKRLGFDGIEMDSPNGHDNADVVEASKASGLPIHGVVDSVHWAKPFSSPDATVRAEGVAALHTAIEDCVAYGGDSVLVVPAVVNADITYGDAWDRSLEEIRKAVPHAEDAGITIAFENVWNNFILSPLEAARYVDAFESNHVGWYFDVGNIVRYGWPAHWVKALGQRIVKLDIKEYSRSKQMSEGPWAGFGVEIGDGDCDWPQVMSELEILGYQGWATAEVGGGGEERLAEIASRMDRVLGMRA